MKNPARVFASVLACLVCSLVPATAAAMPAAGSNELRIDSTYLMPGYSITGFNHYSMSSGGVSDSQSLFGLGFAYGRFLTNNVELGTSLTLLFVDSGGTATAPGLAPFLRGFFPAGPSSAFYGAAVFGLQYAMAESSGGTTTNTTLLSAGADVGIEFFLADSWSLRVGPTYRYVYESQSRGSVTVTGSEQIIGLNWAIAGYF